MDHRMEVLKMLQDKLALFFYIHWEYSLFICNFKKSCICKNVINNSNCKKLNDKYT